MTDPEVILRQLIVEGYEGAALLAAFGRWWAALGASEDQESVPADPVKIDRVKAAAPKRPSVPVTPPPDNAKAIARKALAGSRLAATTIAVGSRLFEHLNLKTGRCDPGMATLAAAVGIPQRSARRAVRALVDAGLFGCGRHGGRARANSYWPNWPLLTEMAAAADLTRSKSTADPVKIDLQNQNRKPESGLSGGGRSARKRRPPDPRQREMMMPIAGGRAQTPRAGDVADDKARERLWKAFVVHCAEIPRERRAVLYEAYARLPGLPDAIAAERDRKGSGLAMVLAMLTGPPVARTG